MGEEKMDKKVYEKLHNLRLEKGISNKDMASMLGISQSFYSQIEHKSRTLTYKMAVKIAKVFNKKPDDLFYEQ